MDYTKDYSLIVKEINEVTSRSCFERPDKTELEKLAGCSLPAEVFSFYVAHAPTEIIEINGVRLLPIQVIIEENTNYTPGYVLTPLGFCVVASTIEGDVYCVANKEGGYRIVIASHDEIYEGMEMDELDSGIKPIAQTFSHFLHAFAAGQLPSSFYDPEDQGDDHF